MASPFRNSSFGACSSRNERSTPSKRYSLDVFSASRATLQDITADSPNIFTTRSPIHKTPPIMGRSVRELEEKISALQKENFNLKLRMYFITESTPELKSCADEGSAEAVVKQLIDKKVEIESLKKDITEKQDVLKDAAKAIDHLEELQKETERKYEATIKDMEAQLRRLKAQTQNRSEAQISSDALRAALADNEELICELNAKLSAHEATIYSLETKLNEQTVQHEELLSKLAQQDKQLSEATRMHVKEATALSTTTQSSPEVSALKAKLADVTCELQESQEKLQEQMKIDKEACRTIQRLMQIIAELKQDKNNSKKEPRSSTETAAVDAELTETERDRYELVLAEQQTIIQRLEEEVKKSKSDFQALVNSDLWEKNRDVEWLTELSNGGDAKTKTDDVSNQSFTDTDYSKAIEKNKLLQQRLNVLIRRIIADQHNERLVTQLRKELQQTQADTEQAEKWRRECADVCTVLTNRLEELAGFLNSLLKHKSVLGFLAEDRQNAMKRAVNKSMDLSRNLNMTLSISRASIADQSIAQISNLSALLGNLEADELLHATSGNGDDLNEEQLRESPQRKASSMRDSDRRRSAEARKEARRTVPLQQQQRNGNDNCHSESEAWSEPDRNVSLARIGLEDPSSSFAKELLGVHSQGTDSDSDSLGRAKHEQQQQRLEERVAQLELLISQRDKRIASLKAELDEAAEKCKQESARNKELLDKANANVERAALQATLETNAKELQDLRQSFSAAQVKHESVLTALEREKTLLAQANAELQASLAEKERDFETLLAREYVPLAMHDALKRQHLELQQQLTAAERSIESYIENEQDMKGSLLDSERELRNLKRQLDETTLNASRAAIERTKAYHEKLCLETELQKLRAELARNENARRDTTAYDTAQSGYTSEELPMADSTELTNHVHDIEHKTRRTNNNSSPDLGIESDNGRASRNAQADNNANALATPTELESDNNAAAQYVEPHNLGEELQTRVQPQQQQQQQGAVLIAHDCLKVEQEKEEYRRKLLRTRRTLEDTYEKLRAANKQKEQVEKEIRSQLLKTHSVLKDVRTNMETDL